MRGGTASERGASACHSKSPSSADLPFPKVCHTDKTIIGNMPLWAYLTPAEQRGMRRESKGVGGWGGGVKVGGWFKKKKKKVRRITAGVLAMKHPDPQSEHTPIHVQYPTPLCVSDLLAVWDQASATVGDVVYHSLRVRHIFILHPSIHA